ncbi:flagellar filament capping protein FliD [Radicibacter daui]|uniref:flagellar filament capping protein FliD n=1 Tax=Radicibacter daui TaxID=3064829 RepID=UPI0040468AC6
MADISFGNIQTNSNGTTTLNTQVLGVNVEDILKNLEEAKRVPITQKQTLIDTNTKKLSALTDFQTLLTNFQAASTLLRNPGLLSSVTDAFEGKAAYTTSGTLSNPDAVIGISATSAAATGTFQIKVLQTATADQKLAQAQSSKTAAVITSAGNLSINGTNIALTANMSLTDVANAINAKSTAANAKAQVLQLSDGNYRLVISGTETGEVLDIGGDAGVLSDLNFSSLQQTSQSFASKAANTGLSTTDSISINGTALDLSAAAGGDGVVTVQELSDYINGLGIANVSSSVYSQADGSVRLLINSTNSNSPLNITADANATSVLGLTDGKFEEQLSAKVEYNGLVAVRSTNTFDDLISGLTFQIYDSAPNDTINVSVEDDVSTAKTAITDFVDSYNALRDFIKAQSAIGSDGTVSEDALLYGNSLLRSVSQQLRSAITGSALGIELGTGSYSTLADVGITLDASNKLTIDDTKLNNALLTNFDQVKAVFSYQATSSNPEFSSIDRPDVIPNSLAGGTVEAVIRNRGEVRGTTVTNPAGGIEMDVLQADNVLTFDINSIDVQNMGVNGGLKVGQSVQMVDANDSNNFFVATITAVDDSVGGSVSMKVVGKSNQDATGPITNWTLNMDREEVLLNYEGNTATSSTLTSTASTVGIDLFAAKSSSSGSFVLDTDTAYGVGDVIKVSSQSDATQYMTAKVTGYDSATKTVQYTMIDKSGTGTLSNVDVVRQGTSLDLSASDFLTTEHEMTIQAGKSFAAGDKIEIAKNGDEDGTYIIGTVSGYDSTTGKLSFTVSDYAATTPGSYNDWEVRGYNGTVDNGIIRGTGDLDGFVFAYSGGDIRPGQASVSTTFKITDGIADIAAGYLTSVMDQTNGSMKSEMDNLTAKNTKLEDQISRLEDNLTSYLARMQSQFTQVQSLLAELNNTQNTLKAYTNTGSSS